MNWRIRGYRPGDEAALAEVCVRTGAMGGDASGLFDPPGLLPDIYLNPYLAHCPDLAWVVADGRKPPVGYLVATADTLEFDQWFATQWWPSVAQRYPRAEHPTTLQELVTEAGYTHGSTRDPLAAEYPAQLHIDLLPVLQGQGFGRRLIEVLCEALVARGVPGVHLGASKDNSGAIAFYHRLGFTPLPSPEGTQWFGKRLG
ncbi:acetyltransferase (GNAT) family protein [Branchiibius hedensis]|uniref:Acetyltransferase (GNAT) family protein n=2 Tax=Branchiibius hedensis TaxID=672460 RepID=A0A2Y8ZLI5_9MICO|nr:acetyltransferase (GNAT) family protein [Branchiibius hedensis]SSA33200.1 Acetyltransferase (GNAT) family protein [Branchiibius hedensis]